MYKTGLFGRDSTIDQKTDRKKTNEYPYDMVIEDKCPEQGEKQKSSRVAEEGQ